MLASFDTYGTGLPILFKGSDVFKTKLGGFIKILINILVFIYALNKIRQLWLLEDASILTISKLVDLNKADHLNLVDNDFDLMAMMMDTDFATNTAKVMRVPRSVGQIRMVSMKID